MHTIGLTFRGIREAYYKFYRALGTGLLGEMVSVIRRHTRTSLETNRSGSIKFALLLSGVDIGHCIGGFTVRPRSMW